MHEDGVAVVKTQTIRAGRGDLLELHRKRVGRRRRSMRKDQRTGSDSRRSIGKCFIRFFQPINNGFLYLLPNYILRSTNVLCFTVGQLAEISTTL